MIINESLLKVVAPLCKDLSGWANALNTALKENEIVSSLECAHFLAQYAVETGDFNKLVENTNYTSAERLAAIFPKYFYLNTVTPRKYSAKEYAGNPEKIANVVYGNRFGNGDEKSGDGFRYRGRGLCHLTFKDNYKAFQNAMKDKLQVSVLEKPEQLEQPDIAVLAGIWFWKANKVGVQALRNNVNGVTKIINGGTNGLKERKEKTDKLIDYIRVNKL